VTNPVVTDSWFNCYRQGWGKSLQPESFAHPAKVSRNLAKRIYEHMREEGWLKPGDTILDPFSGIGGFALDALIMGCHFIGIELERPFVDMASGCECTGVSKADWVRFYGRLDRMRYSGERYICPRCIAEAKGILPESTPQVALFEHANESLSYRRNSGKIPETKAHHYVGNLEAWAKLGLPGTAVILQGDSRQLLTWNFAGGKVENCIGSPPFTGTSHSDWHLHSSPERLSKMFKGYKCSGGGMTEDQFRLHYDARQDGYGSSPANLGNMKEGGFEAAVGSPPFFDTHKGNPAEGQKGVWGLDAMARQKRDYASCDSPGQLASMREGDITAAIASPPYAQSVNADSHGIDWAKAGPWREGRNRGEDTQHEATLRAQLNYGASPGNLGAMREGSADAICSSPPYADALSHGGQKHKDAFDQGQTQHRDAFAGGYGTTPGNLGNLPPGSLEAVADNCISSPPWEKQLPSQEGPEFHQNRASIGPNNSLGHGRYGTSEGQLGVDSGDTFWAASKTILDQLYLCIKPQGHAVFVCGDFIRAGKRVHFSQQWATLCESVGFKLLHWHTAHKTERYGTQLNTEGGEEVDEVSRISFFRRLQAKKGGETISSEEILCFLRP
jgi:hypothetical protein